MCPSLKDNEVKIGHYVMGGRDKKGGVRSNVDRLGR